MPLFDVLSCKSYIQEISAKSEERIDSILDLMQIWMTSEKNWGNAEINFMENLYSSCFFNSDLYHI